MKQLAILITLMFMTLLLGGPVECIGSSPTNLFNDDAGPSSHKWGICAHEHSDIRDDTFIKLEELGASYLRMDISWHNLEPSRNIYSTEYIKHVSSIISRLETIDMELFPVLTHAPSWAKTLYRVNEGQFWTELEQYHAKVSELWGNKIYYYQIENELNHPDRQPYFKKTDIPEYTKIARTGISTNDKQFKTVLNAICEYIGWKVDMNSWLSGGAKKYIDIIGLDMYPTTWGDTSTLWSDLRYTMAMVNGKNNEWSGKDIMVAETGYSTYSATHNEQIQKEFIQLAIKYLNDIVIDYNKEYGNNKVHMICWYELYDSKTGSSDIENNFGICRTDNSKKTGFNALMVEIGHVEDRTWHGSGVLLTNAYIPILLFIFIIGIVVYVYYWRDRKKIVKNRSVKK